MGDTRMRIAHINASTEYGKTFRYYIDYLTVIEEDKETYTVEENDEGIGPRGDFFYKQVNYDAADDGYASLNMPCWIRCEPSEVSGVIYVTEDKIESGKVLLKEALIKNLDKYIQRYQNLKKLIEK